MHLAVNPFKINYSDSDFIRTGVLNIQRYTYSSVKIMLVLKGLLPRKKMDTSSANMKALIAQNEFKAVDDVALRRLGSICWSLQNGFYDWPEMVVKSKEIDFSNILETVAYVSIPRFDDATVYNKVSVRKKYEKLGRVINEHMEVHRPDIVVCCGTYDLFENMFSTALDINNRSTLENSIYEKIPMILKLSDPHVRCSDFSYHQEVRENVYNVRYVRGK